jgi:hypothetical protein
VSAVFTDPKRQMTLELEEGIATRYRNLLECIAQGVYQRGLKAVAVDLNESPGNLSSMLNEESQRKFGVEDLEAYIRQTGDKTPIHYLVARYLGDEAAARDQALSQVSELLQRLPALLASAGVDQLTTRKPGRR